MELLATYETGLHSHKIGKWLYFFYSAHRYMLHHVRCKLIWREPPIFCKKKKYTLHAEIFV
jgi:hypothetical protein